MSKIIFLLFSLIYTSRASLLTDVSNEIFSDKSDHIIAAFGDFNADKLTDIFTISDHGKSIGIYFQNEKQEKMNYKTMLSLNETDQVITSIMPGDFDYDVQMDLLITLASESTETPGSRPVNARIYWGNNKKVELDMKFVAISNTTLVDQPLLMDWQGDMRPDILAETEPGTRVIFNATDDRELKEIPWANGQDKFRYPSANAFLDLNDDFNADLCITSIESNGSIQYEHWFNGNRHFEKKRTVPLPPGTHPSYVGQPSFVDFNERGIPAILLPICEEDDCKKSSIWIYEEPKDDEKPGKHRWSKLVSDIEHDGHEYTFVKPENNIAWEATKQYIPVILHVGDFNIDGFPDVITVMKRTDNNEQYAVLLFNEACDSCDSKRKLTPRWDSPLTNLNKVIQATFFDIHENGILDVLAVTLTGDDGQQVPAVNAYLNDFSVDASFIKITVVSGKCKSECPGNREPYGVNQPGPSIKYHTAQTMSTTQKSRASILSQSSHFATQLPYVIFGLGQTPNFVDELWVGIPTPPGESIRKEEFTQIIPNSQLIVIPFPNDEPSDWTLQLFITPSRLIYITGFSLLGTCAVCGIICGILHLLEKKEDKLEKQQESQKFHFDAM